MAFNKIKFSTRRIYLHLQNCVAGKLHVLNYPEKIFSATTTTETGSKNSCKLFKHRDRNFDLYLGNKKNNINFVTLAAFLIRNLCNISYFIVFSKHIYFWQCKIFSAFEYVLKKQCIIKVENLQIILQECLYY